jgi:integrase/recombinase XerD
MVVRSLYGFLVGAEMPSGRRHLEPGRARRFGAGRDLAHLRPFRHRGEKLRVKAPRRLVVPLKAEEVRDFLGSLRTWRDLSLVGLMLQSGLRSGEIIALAVEDVRLSEGEIRVWGKGNKERLVPLAPPVIAPLRSYLAIERPRTIVPELFVSLKGPQRAKAMTSSGLRSLFRHHRKGVPAANPHRFRHTFARDMVRAGISLPALMKLMGHSTIHHTMLYVELSPQDVWREFHRVVGKLSREKLRMREDG